MPLYRHYQNVKPLHWQDEHHFIGVVEHAPRHGDPYTVAAYGWGHDTEFYIYEIYNGHIEKIGEVAREELL